MCSSDLQIRDLPQAVPHPAFAAVGRFVQDPALDRIRIFRPDLLQVDQRALPRTKGIVLECGQGDEIGFVHDMPAAVVARAFACRPCWPQGATGKGALYGFSMSSTPLRPSRLMLRT